MKWNLYRRTSDGATVLDVVEATHVMVDEAGIATFYNGTMVRDYEMVLMVNRDSWHRIERADRAKKEGGT